MHAMVLYITLPLLTLIKLLFICVIHTKASQYMNPHWQIQSEWVCSEYIRFESQLRDSEVLSDGGRYNH